MVDVSVCIPVYNEKLALRETITELTAVMEGLEYSYEILVIDDGSRDGCTEDIKDLGVRMIRHKRNLGGGVARMTGIRFARGEIILQTDADGTYPCDEIPAMLEKMKSVDMVIGARRRESATDWWALRVLVKWALRKFAGLLAQRSIPDLNSGLRAYDREMALRYAYLYPRGHSIMSTMTLAFLSGGLAVEFVDVDYRVRKGKSSFRPIRDTFNYLATIIRTITYFDPLRVLLPVIMLMSLVSLGFTVRDLILLDVGDVTPLLWASTLIVLVTAILSDQFARLSRQLSFVKGDLWPDKELVHEESPDA